MLFRAGVVCLAVCVVLCGAAALQAQIEVRSLVPVPDIPGYKTLKADFHQHTIFSDGRVWPTIRVQEAFRDGLDAIALTDHLEYLPHAEFVKVEHGRSHLVAMPVAEQLGIILVPAVEITRNFFPEHSAHFNALFVTNAAELNQPELDESLRRARKQDAFVLWNHPGWRIDKAQWFPRIAKLHAEGLFQGIELVNGFEFYPQAFPWIEEKRLAILANSDIHDPAQPRAQLGKLRPMTLLFARSRDLAGVREALFERRTAALMGGELWGAEQYLAPLWHASVTVENAELKTQAGSGFGLRFRNPSAIPFEVKVLKAPEWFRARTATVHPESVSLLVTMIGRNAPVGAQNVEVELEVTNVHVAPGRNLVVRLPLSIQISPAKKEGQN
jgi:3',5'-nucleoside bisphosphate phosphatase